MLKRSTLNKFLILVCSISFLYLSYVNIAVGFEKRMEGDSAGYDVFIAYVPFLLASFLFIIGNRKRNINWPIILLGGYIFVLFSLNQSNLMSLFRGLGLLLWVFSYVLGNRISHSEEITGDFFRRIMFFVTSALVVDVIYVYFIKGLIQYQVTSDTIFFLVAYAPFLMLYNKNVTLKLVVGIFFVITCFLSLKRSIIIGVIAFFLVFILSVSKHRLLSKGYFWLALVLLIVAGNFLINSVGEVIAARFAITAETGGSGREGIYASVLNHFMESSFLEMLFGHGFVSVRLITGGPLAHNDFLQLLYDGGVFAVLLYVMFWGALIRVVVKNWKNRNRIGNVFSVYGATVALLLVLSMMNCYIYSYMLMSPLTLALGFCNGEISKYQYK